MILWTKGEDLTAEAPLGKAFRAVAQRFRGSLSFVTGNNEETDTKRITTFFELQEAPSPTVGGRGALGVRGAARRHWGPRRVVF